jgi:hypothetical protein
MSTCLFFCSRNLILEDIKHHHHADASSTVALGVLFLSGNRSLAFLPSSSPQLRVDVSLSAAPRRLEDNVDGPLYVNDKVRDK